MREDVAPIMRITDIDRAVEWYARLGFRTVGEHRYEPDLPAYVFVARGDVWLHLSQHEGDARPDSLVYLFVDDDLDAIAKEFGTHVHDNEWGRDLELRDLARGIYPPLLADRGLPDALEAQARKAPLPVTIDTDGVGRYPPEIEAAVYFSVLEALQNVAKYAQASSVVVRLRPDRGELAFSVSDDGRGFQKDSTPYGMGLQNIADRLAALGGTFDVRSTSGEGTTVTGQVPADPTGSTTSGR